MMRDKIREAFRSTQHIQDVRMLDALLYKSRMDLQETREMWKTRTHVMLIFGDGEKNTAPKDFLSRFYEGQNR